MNIDNGNSVSKDSGMKPAILFALTCLAFAIYVFSTVFFKNYLYADGAGYFYSMLRNDGFQLWPVGRQTSQILMQIFAVIGMRLGVTNVGVLGGLLGFGMTFWTALMYLLTFGMLVRCKRQEYIGALIFWMVLSVVFTGFFVQIESLIAAALLAYIFFGILLSSKSKDVKSPSKIGLFVASALTIYMNEYFMVWAVFLIFMIVFKLVRKELGLPGFWIPLNLFYVFAMYTSYLGTKVKSSSDFMASLAAFPRQTDFIVLCLLIVLLLVFSIDYSSFRGKGNRIFAFLISRKKIILGIRMGLQIIIGVFLLVDIVMNYDRIAQNGFSVRIVNLGIPVLFFVLLFLIDELKLRMDTIWISSMMLVAGMAIFALMSSFRYSQYLKEVTDYCEQNRGFVTIEKSQINGTGYCWGWPVQMESLCAQMIIGKKQITCIIVQDGGFQPFRTRNIREYAAFKKYGIQYVGF